MTEYDNASSFFFGRADVMHDDASMLMSSSVGMTEYDNTLRIFFDRADGMHDDAFMRRPSA